MSRLPRSAAAGLLTVLLCLGMSTGPVLADDRNPADPTATVVPSPTETAPAETESTRPEPTETRPAEPTETGPTSSTTSAPTTTAESSPATAPVAPVAEFADLQLEVRFEKPSYRLTERVTAHASVANAGTATATRVVVASTGNLTNHRWDPFDFRDVTIGPGETVEGTLSGDISADADAVRLVVTVSQRDGVPDGNPDDNTVSVSVPIITERGSFRGTVFGDSNGNGAQDPGEALAGLALTISGGTPHTTRTAITGTDGTFLFRDLPVGQYTTRNGVTSGWYLPTLFVYVRGPDDPDVAIRAVREVQQGLTVSLAFSQQSYRVNDRATAVVTLTNTSTVLFSDLTANCMLPNLDPGQMDLGQLTPGRGGVTVPAGETRHYPIAVAVTEQAMMIGHIRLRCAVGAPPIDNGPLAWHTAAARVPGGVATRVTGVLGVSARPDRPLGNFGPPLPGAKVYLRDSITDAVVAWDVTDTNGHFTFCDLPVGPYSFGVVGPWRPWNMLSDFVVQAGEDGSPTHWIYVVRGPEQPDPGTGDTSSGCDGPPPAAAPRSGVPELAATGPGVTRLALSGLLTLLIGTGLVLIARQRPNGPGSRRT